MDLKNKRNMIGTVGAFCLGVLFGPLATIFMICREQWQAKKYGFDIESDDLVRYGITTSIGAVFNLIILFLILK